MVEPNLLPRALSYPSLSRDAKGLTKFEAITRFYYTKVLFHISHYYCGKENHSFY